MLKSLPALAGLALVSLAGCVAPERPEAGVTRPVPAAPAASTASQVPFEDAPMPNRRVRRGSDDQIIRLAH